MDNWLNEYIKRCLKMILRDEYSLLEDFFDVIRKDVADYIIFISRRCFVLYQLFAYINGWKRENVISDRGIWACRKEIEQAYRIVLADDILIWGSAMGTAYELLSSALNPDRQYEIKRVVYCRYTENDDEDIASIHAFSDRSMRECKILTNKMVNSIMKSGIPYTSFLYPFYGKCQNIEIQFEDKDVVVFGKVKATENKWESIYDFKINEKLQDMLEYLSDGACVRYYYQHEEGILCVIPFAFISDVREEYMFAFYQHIAECCRQSGWTEIAEEIESAQDEKNVEKWRYLAMLVSCLISRIIGVVEHVEERFEGGYEKELCRKSLGGIFGTRTFQCLEEMNEESCFCFANGVSSKKEIWKTCLIKPSKGVEKADRDMCLNEMLTQFGDMRVKYEASHKPEDKKINCNELYRLYSDKYAWNVIQAAQIESCDAGIVTYGFEYDKGIGIIAKCGIGERSAVLFSLKFGELIHKYYVTNSESEIQKGVLKDTQREENLNSVLQEADLTEEEKRTFWSCIGHDVNNIYDYYLNY